MSFLIRQPAEKWKPEETEKFFMALQIIGTDFSMIERIFDGQRSREQIKVNISSFLSINRINSEKKNGKTRSTSILSSKTRKDLAS